MMHLSLISVETPLCVQSDEVPEGAASDDDFQNASTVSHKPRPSRPARPIQQQGKTQVCPWKQQQPIRRFGAWFHCEETSTPNA